MFETMAKDQEHRRKCSPKKKRFSKIFSGDLQKKVLKQIFSGKLQKERCSKILYIFSDDVQNFNNLKNSAVLEPRAGQFSRT